MRIATATLLLVALVGVSSHATVHGDRVPSNPSQPLRLNRRRKLQQQQPWLGQVRGGGVSWGSPQTAKEAVARVRGGRTSDTAVLVEAAAETALESGLIVGFVGAAEYLTNRFASEKYSEVARLVMWTAAVFLSGAATAGPRRWLESSQLLQIETTISEDWYAKLRKPWWNPPNWVFPIMWVPLKILQVFACFEMWGKLSERKCTAAPVVVYAVYKSLGDVWNKVFFERRRLKMGTVVISAYYLVLLAGIKLFSDVSDSAGYLFAPTAAWVTVATCLQWSTWLLNRDQKHA